jgi:hypothetical protein
MAGTATATVTSRKGRGIVRVDVDLAVTSSTTIAATSIGSFFGRLVGVLTDNTAGAGTTMPDTADLLLTDAATGAPILSDLSMVTGIFYRPTAVVVDSAGAAITPATTANDLNRDIFVAGKVNIAVANAVNGDTARVSLIFAEAV